MSQHRKNRLVEAERRNALLKQFWKYFEFCSSSIDLFGLNLLVWCVWAIDSAPYKLEIGPFYCFENIQFQYSINKIAFRDRKDATLKLLSECFLPKSDLSNKPKLPTTDFEAATLVRLFQRRPMLQWIFWLSWKKV